MLDFAATDLSTNSGLLNLSQGLFDARVAQQEFELSQPSRASILRNERFRIGKAQAAADFNAIGTDFIDFDSDAVRYNIAAGIAFRDKQELTNIALCIVASSLVIAGGVGIGSLIIRGIKSIASITNLHPRLP